MACCGRLKNSLLCTFPSADQALYTHLEYRAADTRRLKFLCNIPRGKLCAGVLVLREPHVGSVTVER